MIYTELLLSLQENRQTTTMLTTVVSVVEDYNEY